MTRPKSKPWQGTSDVGMIPENNPDAAWADSDDSSEPVGHSVREPAAVMFPPRIHAAEGHGLHRSRWNDHGEVKIRPRSHAQSDEQADKSVSDTTGSPSDKRNCVMHDAF